MSKQPIITSFAAQNVLACFELARDQECTLLRLLRQRGADARTVQHQSSRYMAACAAVDALEAYAQLLETH